MSKDKIARPSLQRGTWPAVGGAKLARRRVASSNTPGSPQLALRDAAIAWRSGPGASAAGRAWQWLWSCQAWPARMMVLGAAGITVMLAVREPAPVGWHGLVTAVVFTGCLTVFLATSLPRIAAVRDPASRAGLRAAWWAAMVGAVLTSASFLFLGEPSLRHSLSAAGDVVFAASVALYVVVTAIYAFATVLMNVSALALLALMMIGMVLLPPVVVFMMTNGKWPTPLLLGPAQANSGLADFVELVPLVAVLGVPEVLRRILPFAQAKPTVRRLVPSWLAAIALAGTDGYALLLHFRGAAPLAATPLTSLSLAILFTAAVLWPLYRAIASACWRHGVAKAALASGRWAEQARALRQVLAAFRTWGSDDGVSLGAAELEYREPARASSGSSLLTFFVASTSTVTGLRPGMPVSESVGAWDRGQRIVLLKLVHGPVCLSESVRPAPNAVGGPDSVRKDIGASNSLTLRS